jgi:hypothetical protein
VNGGVLCSDNRGARDCCSVVSTGARLNRRARAAAQGQAWFWAFPGAGSGSTRPMPSSRGVSVLHVPFPVRLTPNGYPRYQTRESHS